MPERTILITGAAGEMGGYLVDRFLQDDWAVCGLDRKSPANVDRVRFSFQVCELSDGADTEEKIGLLHENHGAFDAVINCAGLIANSPLVSFVDGRLAHHDFTLWDRILSSCLTSAFHVTACTAPLMVTSGKSGVIVNISSICSRGNRGQAAYSAAKGGLNSLTLALAKELGSFGIRVVAVAPGYFDTTSTRNNVPPERLDEITASVPLKRLGKLEEVFSAVNFILDNAYMNGTVLELDGGLTL
ncbi:MAG TPA: SDR family oxidoreductase [Chthoniobacterales bacterium]|jgi:3-oxoacyl-[acyl-carrier protein] reductase